MPRTDYVFRKGLERCKCSLVADLQLQTAWLNVEEYPMHSQSVKIGRYNEKKKKVKPDAHTCNPSICEAETEGS
jgi:hypothetical protein